MATLSTKYLRFVKSTSTGPQTVTGVGFRGKALLLWSTHQTALGATTGAVQSFGITDGVLQSCRFIRHPGGEATTTSSQAEQTDHLVYKVSATSGATPTVQAAGVFTNFTSDGFVIDWTTNDSDADIFHVLVLGGDMEAALRVVKIDAATVDVTDLDFRPSSFIVLGGAADEFGAGDYNVGAPFGSIHGFGFSDGLFDDGDASALNDVCIWTLGVGGGVADTYRGNNDDIAASIRVANTGGAAVMCEGRIIDRTDSGYTFQRVGSASNEPVQHILALKGVRIAIRRVTARGTTGTQTTTLPFQPDVLLANTINRASSDNTSGMALGFGVWDRANAAHGGSFIAGVDGANPSVYRRSSFDTYLVQTRNASSGAVEVQAAVSASTTSSVTLNYTNVGAGTEDIDIIALSAVPQIVGAFVAGVDGTVRSSRSTLFSLDGETNELQEEGKFKVAGKFEVEAQDQQSALRLRHKAGLGSVISASLSDPGSFKYAELGFGLERDPTTTEVVARDTQPGYAWWQNEAIAGMGMEVVVGETVDATVSYAAGAGFGLQRKTTATTYPWMFRIYDYGSLGTGNIPGMGVLVERNASGNGAASYFALQQKDGTTYYHWIENGQARRHTAPPTENNSSVAHTAGLAFGTLTATVTLTNAQILALPTSGGITIVAAPGDGYRVKPIAATAYINNNAGAYTNVNTTYSSLQIETADGSWLAVIINDSSGGGLSDVTSFFNTVHNPASGGTGGLLDFQVPASFPSSNGYIQMILTTARTSVNNQAIRIVMDNNGSGDLTGGNAANSMRVTVTYVLELI